jgi:DNA-directed RNA polymerase specialized sigma24 family protein
MNREEGPLERPPADLPDADLARLAARGGEAVFEAIFDRHGQDLFRFCCAMAGARSGQELFSRAVQRVVVEARAGGAPAELAPWLFGQAHDEAQRSEPGEQVEPRHAAAGAGLVARFGDLSRTQRGGLVLGELAGLGYQAIARVFHVSPGTARQVVTEARVALHAFIPPAGPYCGAERQLLAAGEPVRSAPPVQEHLRRCKSCQSVGVSMAGLGAALRRELPRIEKAAVAAVLKEAVARANEAQPAKRRPDRRPSRVLLTAAAFVLLMAVAALGVFEPRLDRDAPSMLARGGPALRSPIWLAKLDSDHHSKRHPPCRNCAPTPPNCKRAVEGVCCDGRSDPPCGPRCTREVEGVCCDGRSDSPCGPRCNREVEGVCCDGRSGPPCEPKPCNRTVEGVCCDTRSDPPCMPRPKPCTREVEGVCCDARSDPPCVPRPEPKPCTREVEGVCCDWRSDSPCAADVPAGPCQARHPCHTRVDPVRHIHADRHTHPEKSRERHVPGGAVRRESDHDDGDPGRDHRRNPEHGDGRGDHSPGCLRSRRRRRMPVPAQPIH